MPIEAATFITTLDASNPPSTDLLAEGDDHLRLLKSVLKASFPNISGAMTATHTILNGLDGRMTSAESSITSLNSSVSSLLPLFNEAKASVLVATTGNITLSGEQTIDGVLTNASRVLVRSQTTASQNGIYVSSTGSWTRSTDFDVATEITGAYIAVETGTTLGDTLWLCTNDAGDTVGVTAINFNRVDNKFLVNAQTGTTYTFVASDRFGVVSFNNASPVAVTLPVATTSGFGRGFLTVVKNIGAGTVTITPTTSSIGLGTALVLRTGEWAFIWSDGSNYDAFHSGRITGNSSVREVGTRGIPVVTADLNYQFAFGDEGSLFRHTSATPHTWTIPANSGTPFPVGTAISGFAEPGSGAITIAITTDVLNRGDGVAGTGSRTISANGFFTLVKTSATTWVITGAFT